MRPQSLLEKRRNQARVAEVGKALHADHARHVETQLAKFRERLADFASKYRQQINKDPIFRNEFARMTKAVGVDPLASNKGFWGELLGLGDFYYELGVQAMDICMATRAVNGGIISLEELCAGLRKVRARSGQAVSPEDVRRAIGKLAVLGGGYRVVVLGGQRYVLSVPSELSPDSTMVLQACAGQHRAFASAAWLAATLRWEEGRARAACQALLADGLAWLDAQGSEGEARYYFQALWVAQGAAAAAGSAASAANTAGSGGGSPVRSASSFTADGVLEDDKDE